MKERDGTERILGQDGFSVRLAPGPAREPVRRAEPGRLELCDNADGTFTVVRCVDLMADDLDLTREAGGRPVSMIAARAFQHCGGIRRIVLPDGLRQIGEMAFLGCAQLQRVDVPGSVERIGTLAFARCQKLTHVRLQPGVRAIGPSAFQKCPALERVDMPVSLVSFGGGLFLGSPRVCLHGAAGSAAEAYAKQNGVRFDSESWRDDPVLILEEQPDETLAVTGLRAPQRHVEIPRELCGRAVSAIAPRAFFGQPELESVSIGGARYIGENAFMGCPALTNVSIDRGLEEIAPGAFAGCESLPQIMLPWGTRIVRRMAFFGCARLAFVKMPSATRVEELAFDGCSPSLQVFGGVAAARG